MGDSTGTIHARSVTVFDQISTGVIRDTFVVATGASLKKGQAVKLISENEVGPLTAATDVVIGHVMNGGVEDEEVTVMVNYALRATGFNNTGATIPAGAKVRQVVPAIQTETDKMDYAVAVAGETATGIALCESLDQNDIKVGILNTPEVVA